MSISLNRPVDRIFSAVDWAVGIVISILLVADAALIFFSVARRALTGSSITWAYEVAAALLIGMAFLGGASVVYRDEHIGMAAASRLWPVALRPTIASVGLVSITAFTAIVGWQSFGLLLETTSTMLGTGWSEKILYAPLVLGSVLAIPVLIVRLQDHSFAQQVIAVAICSAAVLIGWLANDALSEFAFQHPLLTSAFVVVGFLVLGIPLAFVLGLSALVLLFLLPGTPLQIVPLQMVGGINHFVMLAMPFFILTGGFLASSGMSSRLMRFVDDITCSWRGGTAIAAVAGMYLVSGISGSKIADVAAVGPVIAPEMAKKGHSEGEVVGVLSAAAAMGEVVPPSLAILVLTGVTTVSTGALFLAGLLPAAVVSLAIVAMIYFRARAAGIEASPRPPLRTFATHLVDALVPLGMPIVIFAGIIFGIATPIEASSLAVIYGLLVSLVVYRVGWREVGRLVVVASRLNAMLLFILATTGFLAWVLTVNGSAAALAQAASLLGQADGHLAFMLASVTLLVIAGMVFEGLPALVLFAPLLLPVATAMGINDLQYSIVLILAMGVGAFLPPLGVGYFATCAIVGVPPERAIWQTVWYKGITTLGIVLIAVIPGITTVVPRFFGMIR